jgi:tetraacyldisaccharide 4'-kinase
MTVRNFFYDMGFLSSKMHDFPVISVGNLSMGGTGKSPHVEYLIRLLKRKIKIATLSRVMEEKLLALLRYLPNTRFWM